MLSPIYRHIKAPKSSVATEPEDEDVEREKQRILSGRATEDTIRIENLSKVRQITVLWGYAIVDSQ